MAGREDMRRARYGNHLARRDIDEGALFRLRHVELRVVHRNVVLHFCELER